MLIQAALQRMVRPRKIDLRPRNLRNFLVQGAFRGTVAKLLMSGGFKFEVQR
ncbi:hypothetical protein ACZ87_03553 [Candidatus Erwinia dacicola]|uniref:Uncharacterized protein n=1 Tax=Candidatus Erwinia dacicola TaxID=252393 RepID=A0A328TGD2_9GAMM|nr:hypothetical protein ACZ87_03553 [Candidatus Erwinia dacicola]